jgi:hypothetical protein
MTRSVLLLARIFGGLAWPVLAAAETGGAQQIPDFSGGWDRVGNLVETYEAIPGYAGAGPLLVDPLHPHVNGSRDRPGPRRSTIHPEIRNLGKAAADYRGGDKRHPAHQDEGHCQPSGVPEY